MAVLDPFNPNTQNKNNENVSDAIYGVSKVKVFSNVYR